MPAFSVRYRSHAPLLAILLMTVGCTATGSAGSSTAPVPTLTAPTLTAPTLTAPTTAAPTTSPSSAAPSTEASVPPRPKPSPTRRTAKPTAQGTGPADPRWQFFVEDKTRYRSAWFAGAHRIMIGYGCTPAPFYRPDPRCDGDGFHHGIDVALPCRTDLFAGVDARVVDPDRPGSPGPAYGSTAFRIRVQLRGEPYDVLIGHAARVFVRPGDRVRAGERIATAGARGSPDGCHLHFEQRRVDGGVGAAVDPTRLLDLEAT